MEQFLALSKKLKDKLAHKKAQGLLRSLQVRPTHKIDFASNDYLGLSKIQLAHPNDFLAGATGSRLLTGHYPIFNELENTITKYHQGECALLFNSGYDANVGAFAALTDRHDHIFYDELVHASIRDGIRLAFAHAYRFAHNDLNHLESLLKQNLLPHTKGCALVVVESIYSMDGDAAPLTEIIALCKKYNATLYIDEAHSFGVLGERGAGLANSNTFADTIRLYTYGKAGGRHGAALVCNEIFQATLVNYCRSLIYTTALPPKNVADLLAMYQLIPQLEGERAHLKALSQYFQQQYQALGIPFQLVGGAAALYAIIIPTHQAVRQVALGLQAEGFDVRPILAPTVPEKAERLRICLHAYNTTAQIDSLLTMIQQFAQHNISTDN